MCPIEHTTHNKISYALSIIIAHNSDYRSVCRVPHTSCHAESFVFFWIIANSSCEWTVCRLSHTPWYSWPFVFFFGSSQMIRMDQLYAKIRTSNSNLNRAWWIHHRTQFILLVTGFFLYRLRFMHLTQFDRRVSDSCVALAASWRSDFSVAPLPGRVCVSHFASYVSARSLQSSGLPKSFPPLFSACTTGEIACLRNPTFCDHVQKRDNQVFRERSSATTGFFPAVAAHDDFFPNADDLFTNMFLAGDGTMTVNASSSTRPHVPLSLLLGIASGLVVLLFVWSPC